MKYLSALFAITMILCSCSTEPKSEYQGLYSAFEGNPSPETFKTLMDATIEKIRELEVADPERKEALETGYKASKQMNNTAQAVGFLNTYIRDYPEDPSTADKLYELGVSLNSANKAKASTTILQGFIQNYPQHEKVVEAQKLIPEGSPSAEDLLQDLGSNMFQSEEGQLNRQAARNYVDVCEAYALTHPNDPKSADYLHKAAETARAIRTIPKALALYDWILEKYPNHDKAPQALFLKAFTYDNNLNDVENARENYEAFLAKYPEDDFADDTKFLLENLGKTDEEILEALTKKAENK